MYLKAGMKLRSSRRYNILILAFTPVERDPRVRRWAYLLREHDLTLTGVGKLPKNYVEGSSTLEFIPIRSAHQGKIVKGLKMLSCRLTGFNRWYIERFQ